MKAKKLTAVLLTTLMILSLSLTSLAAPAPAVPQDTGTITVTPVSSYHKIAAYQIIRIVQMVADNGTTYDAYEILHKAELIAAINTAKGAAVLAAGASNSEVLLYITNSLTGADMAAVALALEAALNATTPDYVSGAGNFSGNTITLEVELGYYLILDTTNYADPELGVYKGNLFPIMGLVNDTLNVNLKSNTTPIPVKTAYQASYNVGDTVTYTVEVDVPYFNFDQYPANTIEYVVKDTMGTGLDFGVITSIKLAGDPIVPTVTTIAADGTGFTLTFGPNADIGGLLANQGKTLEIVYTATVTADAPTDGTGLINEVEAGYIEDDYTGDDVTVYTYGIDLTKEDEYGNKLEGVKFSLYTGEEPVFDDDDNLTSTSQLLSFDGAAGDYVYGTAVTELVTDANGKLVLWGLAEGTYWLVENETLDGYRLLAGPVEIVIADAQPDGIVDGFETAYYELTVVNYTGILIPGTGGMGTVLFTVVGFMVIMGAGAMLVVNRKRVFSK